MIQQETRQLLLTSYEGVLSSHSQYMPGYPFGSVAPFCLDEHGQIVILISELAQHTKNLKADPRCSLLVMGEGEDVQSAARLTVVGDAEPVPAADIEAIACRYYRYFPQSLDFHRIHDFSCWRIKPVKYRYIGGFGRIHWAEPLLQINPFWGEVEAEMVNHMNADHADTLPLYCQQARIVVPSDTPLAMVGIDSEGFHLRLGQKIVYIAFPQPVHRPQQVRATLVSMLKAARAGVTTP